MKSKNGLDTVHGLYIQLSTYVRFHTYILVYPTYIPITYFIQFKLKTIFKK